MRTENFALVCPYDYFTPGGVRDQVLGLRKQLVELGHSVKLFFPGTGEKVELPDVFFIGRGIPAPTPTQSWGTITIQIDKEALRGILTREQFSVIHLNEPVVPSLPRAVLETASDLGFSGICLGTVHAAWPENYSREILESLARQILRITEMENQLDGLIAVSAVAKKCWQPLFRQSQIEVIPNGIDLDRFNPRVQPIEKYGKSDKVKILFVGRFDERKGAQHLLTAFKMMPKDNLQLILVGDGPKRADLEAQVATDHLEDLVDFPGAVSDLLLPRWFATADIFCAPSTGFESFGVVLLEAMASGKPIVCFANAGYSQLMKKYPFAEGLVEPEDDQGLAKALTHLVEQKSLRKKLEKWGWREVQQYSWPRVAHQFLDKIERFR